jgi:transposase InsO family protein
VLWLGVFGPLGTVGTDVQPDFSQVHASQLFLLHGLPDYLRSDNGAEFTATAVREWLHRLDVQTLFIEPDGPWENGYNKSINGKLREEMLNGEIFYTLKEARILVEQWRIHYNTVRPHSSLSYQPPAPQAIHLLVMPAATTQQ